MRSKEHVLEGAQQRKTALGVRGLLTLLLWAFGIFGLWSGYAVVLLADLSGALDLSPGPLSVALVIGTVASLAAMPALGWTADGLGRKVFLVAVTCFWGPGSPASPSPETSGPSSWCYSSSPLLPGSMTSASTQQPWTSNGFRGAALCRFCTPPTREEPSSAPW